MNKERNLVTFGTAFIVAVAAVAVVTEVHSKIKEIRKERALRKNSVIDIKAIKEKRAK